MGRVGDLPEGGVPHGGLDDQGQVGGGGVVVFVVEAVGVGEVGAGAAQGLGLVVHQLDKGLNGAGYVLGDDVAGLIGRGHHDAVEEVPQGQHLAGHQARGAAVLVEVLQRRLRDRHLVVQIAVFQRQIGRHHLGEAGGEALLGGVEGVERGAGVQLDQQGRADGGIEDLGGGGGVQGREVRDRLFDGGNVRGQSLPGQGQRQAYKQQKGDGFSFHMVSYVIAERKHGMV